MLTLEIKEDTEKGIKILKSINTDIKDFKPTLKKVGILMLASVQHNFIQQGRPTRWKPLAPMTLAMRRGKGSSSAQILRDTGRLMNSINYKVENDQVKIGTNVPYASIHQFGSTIRKPAYTERVKDHTRKITSVFGKKVTAKSVKVKGFTRNMPAKTVKVPKRKFLMYQKEDLKAIEDLFTGHIDKSLKNKTGAI